LRFAKPLYGSYGLESLSMYADINIKNGSSGFFMVRGVLEVEMPLVLSL